MIEYLAIYINTHLYTTSVCALMTINNDFSYNNVIYFHISQIYIYLIHVIHLANLSAWDRKYPPPPIGLNDTKSTYPPIGGNGTRDNHPPTGRISTTSTSYVYMVIKAYNSRLTPRQGLCSNPPAQFPMCSVP